MSELALLNDFPLGWHKKVNKLSGEIEDTRKCFQVGDLSALFSLHYKHTLRYNYLSLKAEINGIPIPKDEQDNLYVPLSERGYN